MTRKKSNVKALALAVTCAILAGGGIGLEPVYAADVTLSLTNGAITAGSVIGTINGTVGGKAIADGTITDGSLTNGKFSGTVTLTGDDIKTAIESVDISKAKVGSDATSGTIESLVKNVGDNSNAIQAVNGQVTNLDSKVEAYNTNLNTKITEQVSTLDAKINTKVNASDFSAYQVKNDNAVDTLKYNTQKIEFKKDNKVTSDDATYIEGITHAGDVRLAKGEVRAKSIVLEEEFANGTSAQATLTREAIVNLNGMTDGKTIIKVADGSEVGGVTFNHGKVTNVVSINDNLKFESDGIYLNKGDQAKQIKIGTDGKIIIGTSSSAYDTNGFYAGGDDYNAAKAAIKSDGSLKATKFAVDGANGNTTVGGTLGVTGKTTLSDELQVDKTATFGNVGNQTTIEGKTVTTDTLKANKLILGASGANTVVVDKDGSLKAAGGKFEVDKDGALKAADGAFTVDKDGKTTFTKDADNLSSINGGNIWAKATDAANHTSSELQHDSTGLHVSGTHAGKTSAFAFDAATGISTFTGQDNSTVTINGSAIRSAKSDGTAGRLDGENLTLYKDANNQTTMSAGKATFKSDNAGKYNGKETTIDGGVITTDTLNVQRINLGKEMVNSDGTTTNIGSNLSIDEYGNIKAAGGNFTVAGTDQGNNKGALHNEVGNTSFNTTVDGASMKFNNTAATGGVESKVTVEANKATVATGDKASFVANADNGGSATITGGTQTVTTTDNGTEFKNSAHNTPFEGGNATTTIINGNEITTGKITTDQLVITGQGNAHGNGSIAFGGNGTIKSDINDGTANGKNTSFETTLDGVNTKVTDGTTTTENKVTAAGNSNTVTKDEKHKSEYNQGLTSIGGVVTNGEIKVAQKLDGETGLLTNEVKDANGSSKLEQSGTGLTYTDSAKPDNATRIDSSDVSIGSATEPDKRINLSDLGQIDELDKEIRDNEVYKKNETAVGGINAEAAIRRGEVERLDNRISEEVTRLDGRINDVNDRVNKVGAMAAAIASLKSIGYDPQAPSEFSIGLGQYKGETGVAMGFFHYPNKNFMINVSLSTAGGETMGGIGATWRFGHKSPQKLLEEQREAQAKKELAAAEKYQAAAKLAKEAQERAEYAAKLARQAQVSADNAKAAADATQAKHFG